MWLTGKGLLCVRVGVARGVGLWKSTHLVGRGGRGKQVSGRCFGMGSTGRPPASSAALGSLLFQA